MILIMFVAINYKKEMKKELFIACSLCGTMLVMLRI